MVEILRHAEPPPKKVAAGVKLLILAMLAGSVVFCLVIWNRSGAGPRPDKLEMDFPDVPKDTGPKFRKRNWDSVRRQGVPTVRMGDGTTLSTGSGESSSKRPAPAEAPKKRGRAGERAFIKKYDHVIRSEHARLHRLGSQYYRKYKVVREVDAAFRRLPRYMALRRQYKNDHDFYKFTRGVVSLPEFRKTVRKYALNVDVWKAGLQFMDDALKEKPPKPVYDEVLRHLTNDRIVGGYLTDVSEWLSPHVPKMVTRAMEPGMDLTAISGAAQDVQAGIAKRAMEAGASTKR